MVERGRVEEREGESSVGDGRGGLHESPWDEHGEHWTAVKFRVEFE